MSTILTLNKQPLNLLPEALLGVGGEAEVYRVADQAIKVFHPLSKLMELNPAVPKEALQRRHEEKIKKLKHFPAVLPASVITPRSLVYRGKHIAGYAMNMVPQANDIRMLSVRRFRDGIISNAQVGALFTHLLKELLQLHQAQVVIGDFNDANVLFTLGRTAQTWFIDADSMQFDGYPCPVATERFLDPLLYGLDLSAAPLFSTHSDYFAYAALLLQSWLFVGPYGGRHPGYATWMRRTEARISVLSTQVQYPKAATRPDILPDDLLSYFTDVFEHDKRIPLQPDYLASLPWTRCRCGLEHARAVCPCNRFPAKPIEIIVTRQGVRHTVLFSTSGHIITARIDHGTMQYIYDDGNAIRREDGSLVIDGKLEIGMRLVIAGGSTWAGRGTQLLRITNGIVKERAITQLFGNLPMFDATASRLVYLKDRELRTLHAHAQIMPHQTWFSVGTEFGLGFYRVGAGTVYFVFDFEQSHSKVINLPGFTGRVLDVQCSFDRGYVALFTSEEREGKIFRRLSLIHYHTATVVASLEGYADDSRALSSAGTRLLLSNRVVIATDEGLLLLEANAVTGQWEERRLFAETEPFVVPGAQLLPAPHGGIYHVTEKEVSLIELTN